MTAPEERLRAAMTAAAATVTPGSAPPLRLPAAPPRRLGRRWFRALVPLAAAASVVAVLGSVLAITGGADPDQAARTGVGSTGVDSTGTARTAAPRPRLAPATRPGAPARAVPAGVPAYYVALTSTPGTPQQRAVVRATATGAVLAHIAPPRPYGTFTHVSAAADDQTFVLSAQRWWPVASGARGMAAEKRDSAAPVAFFRLRIDPAAGTARLTVLQLPQRLAAADLAGLALSPDGSQLALAVRTAGIQVITLATGAARAWTWPYAAQGSEWVGNAKPYGAPLSWVADGHILAFQFWAKSGSFIQVRLLDTAAPGGDLSLARSAVTFASGEPGSQNAGLQGNTLITPDGSEIVTVTVPQNGQSAAQIAEFSVTGAPAKVRFSATVVPQQVLWTNSSGSVLIVSGAPPGHPGRSVFGVLAGPRFIPLPGGVPATGNVAW